VFTSAAKVALPAFAAARRAAAQSCCGTRRAAIDRYLLPAGPSAANLPIDDEAACGVRMGHTGRQTDRRRKDGCPTVT